METDNIVTHYASEAILAEDRLTPEEDAAWASL